MIKINRFGADIIYHFQSKNLVVTGKAIEKINTD